jgi:hypothetical protein
MQSRWFELKYFNPQIFSNNLKRKQQCFRSQASKKPNILANRMVFICYFATPIVANAL